MPFILGYAGAPDGYAPEEATFWWLAILMGVVVLIGLGINAAFFSMPQMRPVPADAAGRNVQSIEVHANSALVVVNQDWIDNVFPFRAEHSRRGSFP